MERKEREREAGVAMPLKVKVVLDGSHVIIREIESSYQVSLLFLSNSLANSCYE